MIKQLIMAGMGDVTFLGATEAVNASSITLPTVAAKDVVIVASLYSANAAPSGATGYTVLKQGIVGSSLGYAYCRKVLSAADTEATGLSQDGRCSHIALAFRFVNNTTPIDVTTPNAAEGESGGMPNPPSITSVSRGEILIIGFLDTQLTATAPSGYTLAVSHDDAIAGTLMAAYRKSSPGTYDADAFGGTGGTIWAAGTVALRAA